MAKLPFKAPAESDLVNTTFIGTDSDDEKRGILGLHKVSNAEPDAIADVQVAINTNITDIAALDVRVTANEGDISTLQTDLDALELIVDGGAWKAVSFVDDASYEGVYGAPVGGEFYYNSTSGKLRQYNAVDTEWKNVGAGGVATQESLGTGDGVTTDFALTLFPTSDESILVARNGLTVDISEYTYAAGIITFLTAPAAGQSIYAFYLTEGDPVSPPVSAGTFNVEYPEITAPIQSAKQLTLSATPAVSTQVVVDVISGSSQRYGADFTVSGTTLDWNGLGLDGVLNIGDYLRVQYFS